jgi:hypothetical protein
LVIVVDMRDYMTDLDASREREPSGGVVVLDHARDGRAD